MILACQINSSDSGRSAVASRLWVERGGRDGRAVRDGLPGLLPEQVLLRQVRFLLMHDLCL